MAFESERVEEKCRSGRGEKTMKSERHRCSTDAAAAGVTAISRQGHDGGHARGEKAGSGQIVPESMMLMADLQQREIWRISPISA